MLMCWFLSWNNHWESWWDGLKSPTKMPSIPSSLRLPEIPLGDETQWICWREILQETLLRDPNKSISSTGKNTTETIQLKSCWVEKQQGDCWSCCIKTLVTVFVIPSNDIDAISSNMLFVGHIIPLLIMAPVVRRPASPWAAFKALWSSIWAAKKRRHTSWFCSNIQRLAESTCVCVYRHTSNQIRIYIYYAYVNIYIYVCV